MQAEIRGYFEAEAQELIDRLTQGAQSLPQAFDQAEEESLRAMLRAAHTLKGASHVVGEGAMAAMAHAFEDVVAAYRKGQEPEARARLLQITDELSAGLRDTAPPALVPATSESASPAAQKHAEEIAGVPAAPAHPAPGTRTARVDLAEAGQLLESAAQGNVLANSMRKLLDHLDALEEAGTVEFRRLKRKQIRRDLHDDLDRLERQLQDVYRMSSRLQLGSSESLLLEAGRVVRSTAAQLGKPARCVTSGGEERLEAGLLDALQDALLHLIRNALAHGVESAEERAQLGKPAIATITVSLQREGGNIILRCEDDGRGIALEQVRAAAVAQGELTAAQAELADRQTLLALLLRPGFSLSQSVNEVSGRGVGLDAVRAVAERVGGRVEVQSQAGRGATFALIAPQRQFAVTVLQVWVAGRVHALPASCVTQTFMLQAHHRRQLQGSPSLLVGGETMPFLALKDMLAAIPGTPPASYPPVFEEQLREQRPGYGQAKAGIVVSSGHARIVLGVDRIETLREMVVHPLPPFARVHAIIAGCAVAPDGVPLLVLHPPALVQLRGTAMGSRKPEPAAAPVRLPVLVIDDSLTTRMLEQSILEAEGYTVEVAVSAEQGLAMARSNRYALFLVDVEMPGMNGYEFVSTVRDDKALKSTPCIMVTSLDSEQSRRRGHEAGAYSYIVKGEFNQGVYLERIRAAVAQGEQAQARVERPA